MRLSVGMNTNEAARMLSDSQTSHTRWAACTQRWMRLLNMFTGLGEVPWLVPPWTIRGCPADAASLRLEHQLDPMGRPPWPPMPRIARPKGGEGLAESLQLDRSLFDSLMGTSPPALSENRAMAPRITYSCHSFHSYPSLLDG